jgi:outer membrane protein insertion porin family
MEYGEVQEFEIGGVKVTGAKYRDENAIVSISGLRIGQKISIPGTEIPGAIKSLWKLKLFTDIEVLQEKKVGDVIFLEIRLKERPTLSRYSYKGVKKTKHEDLNGILEDILIKGGIVTEDVKSLAELKIKEYWYDKGFMNAVVSVEEFPDTSKVNASRLVFNIDKKNRVRIKEINFIGNEVVKSRRLRRTMKETKRKWTLFKKSKFIEEDLKDDERAIVALYNSKGFRDASIVRDSIWMDEKNLHIDIEIEEGNRYYFRNISWKGNSIHDDERLSSILGIAKGDVYNDNLLETRLNFSQDGRDVSSLYMDDGYLFFRAEPTEISVVNDSVDLQIRIYEGPQATIDRVVITGNDRTHDHVVRRALRTRPGEKFSRSDIIRSQREIINLGYFNPENLSINTPVNPQRGTVDIEYGVEERPADQLELSAGYGGISGLIGTLGVTFNNFSLRNINNRKTWNPLPMGDGQKLSVRAQSNSNFFQSYNFSFTEPWLGGKKPNSFTLGSVYSKFDYRAYGTGLFAITRGFVGWGTQLRVPDDYFVYNATANIERIKLDDYSRGGFGISDGTFYNFSLNQTIVRSSINEPIFPRRGSRISLSLQLTPYYWWRSSEYQLTPEEQQSAITKENLLRGDNNPMSTNEESSFITRLEQAKRFKYLEYHKWRFDAEWYFNIWDKLVLMTSVKMGVLGYYQDGLGISPFERFELGGDGISNQQAGITGKDIIALRGYEVSDIQANNSNTGGATIFDKFTMELRYPLSLQPNSTIYVAGFLQGGNAWERWRDFNPFDINRSAGIGLRVFLPMFGLLGFDYGFGIDRALDQDAIWTDYGKFSIILGFEPD